MREFLKGLKFNINIPFLFVSLLHFAATFFNDTIAFKGEDFLSNKVYYFIKFILFAILVLFWQLVAFGIKKIKEKDETAILFIRYFFIYFLIMFVFLLLTWPGVWRADDFSTYYFARMLLFDFWQHWLMSVFDMISLSMIPFPVGIVINQIFLISVVVGYIISQFHLKISSKYAFLLFIPLLFPSVVSNNLCPVRLILFGYCEVLLFSILAFKYIDKTKLSMKNIFIIGVLTSFISTIRAESLFFIIAIPVLVIVLFFDQVKWKKLVSLITIISVLTIPIIHIQNLGLKDKKYLITGFIEPLANIVKTDFKSNNKQKDIEIIDHVIDYQLLQEKTGTKAFDQKGSVKNSDKESVYALLFTYLKLVYYNFPVFAKERIKSFTDAIHVVITDNPDSFRSRMYHPEDFPNKPFDTDLRFAVVKFLECRKQSDFYQYNSLFKFFYNPVINLSILLGLLILGIFKKSKLLISIPLILVIQNIITILTMVCQSFWYFFPSLICSYLFLTMVILYWFEKKTKQL